MPSVRQGSQASLGFSFMELSAVLVIIALVVGMTVSSGITQLDIAKITGTKQSMEVVRQALNLFQKKYGRYPCPADPLLATSHANYGVEYSSGSCNAACPMGGLSCGTNAVIGMVPFKTISLNEGVSYDAWDRRLTYAVDKNHTATSDYNNGSLSVQDGSGNETTASPVLGKAIFVLASHGEDGNGGYSKKALLVKACGAVAKDIENCDYNDDIFAAAPFNNGDVAASYSDDLIAWQVQENVNEEEEEEESTSPNATLALGDEYSCAIKDDGSVKCWGEGDDGRLGNGDTTDRHTATAVGGGLTGAIDIAASNHCTAVLKSDGSVWWWGVCPDGSGSTPRLESNFSDIVQIAGMPAATILGVKNDGTVGWADPWGGAYPPWQVPGMTGIVQAAVSQSNNSCGVKNDGTILCIGENDNGQLGNNSTTDSWATAVQVSTATGLTSATQVAVGNGFACAVKTDGTVWCWGYDGGSALGCGGCGNQDEPIQVSGLSGITRVALSTNGVHACALQNDGTVWCWGDNSEGETGNGAFGGSEDVPAQVPGLTDVEDIGIALGSRGGSGHGHSCARKTNDEIWCWGYNSRGQLGDNTTTRSHTPVQVQNFP
jgi:alpha-tubulin suppressor-like RCC1 family protein